MSSRFAITPDNKIVDLHQLDVEKLRKAQVTRFVTDHLWPLKKMVVLDKELDVDQDVAKFYFRKMNVGQEMQLQEWERVRKVVREKIKSKRNNVCDQIKSAMIGKRNVAAKVSKGGVGR